ncbi:hypothetical protein [Acetilactobacillus jinshanensis]|uniref:Uncharacterized protein n=1 Tax=Acetilactobacillus jinshanensis TaxID=1720083 RepID=A0A4P6ZNC7_9LACO|nr:hypothetical protein [Acetilactobacillus jinshanensis]QBP18720.1 hypothetical protein ELX58_06315 [Acetilactobacillus jinshanensis]URL61592.1 hypothetical protein HGK75_06460 [uncultured bacterium]
MKERKGVTLADSLCGLFILSLGLGLYYQVNQVMKHQIVVSDHQLMQKRRIYEQTLSKSNQK